MKELHYRGFTGSIEYSEEDHLYYGKVLGIRDLVSYEGTSKSELFLDFRSAINDYIRIRRKYASTSYTGMVSS